MIALSPRRSVACGTLLALLLASSITMAADASTLEGSWRITRGLAAPWLTPQQPAPDTHAHIGARVDFAADRVSGPGVLSCAQARYENDARPPEGLFQGGLPAPAADAAARLGLTANPIPSVTLSCDTGLFDVHHATPQAAMLALDNVIWVLDRSPGALAPETTPEHAVQRLLERHFGGDMGFLPALVDNKREWLSTRLQQRIAAYFAQPFPQDEPPPINGDPITNSQEYPVLFSVDVARIDGDTAVVPVRYDDGHRPRPVQFLLVREAGNWRVDDIRYEDDSTFREALQTPAP